MNPLRRLYMWMMRQARGKHAESGLFSVAVMESSFFPLPPDLMLIPMILADRLKAWRLAFICTLGSVIGGIAGYVIGAFLWDVVGGPIVAFYGFEAKMDKLANWYALYGAWIVLLAGFTPIPYKVFTIASGVFGFAFLPFMIFSFIGRGGRFFLIAALLYWGGDYIRKIVEKHLELLTVALAVLLVLGFVAIEFVL